jgi:uncharacterized protein YkwD
MMPEHRDPRATVPGVLHTKRFVGGLLVAATTTIGVVTLDVTVGAIDILNRAATASTAARRVDPPPPPPRQPVAPDQAAAYAVLELVNAERAARGLAPFAWHDRVAAAALAHSNDMAGRDVMTHTGSDGSSAGDRLSRAGFTWTAWGENVAYGYRDAPSVVAGWMASSGHRRQMLGSYTYVGVAAVASADGALYWTMDFADGG